jgi:hypothetical protein
MQRNITLKESAIHPVGNKNHLSKKNHYNLLAVRFIAA